jgi:hypothetical protein
MTDEELEKEATRQAHIYLNDGNTEGETNTDGIDAYENRLRILNTPSPPSEHSYADALPGAAAGAALGYGLSGAKSNPTAPSYKTISKSRATPVVEKLMKVPKGSVNKVVGAYRPPSLIPTAEMTKQILGGSIDPETGTNGRQRMGFNDESQRLSQASKEAQSIGNEVRQSGIVGTTKNPIIETGAMTKTPGNISIPVNLGEELERGALTQAQKVNTAAKVAGALGTIGKVIPFAAAGLQAHDTYNRYNSGDKTGALISGVTGLASIPFPMLASAIGMPIQWVHDNPQEAKEMFEKKESPVDRTTPSDSYNESMVRRIVPRRN